MPSLRATAAAQAACPLGGPGESYALAAPEAPARAPLSVTSHSLSLSTRAFSVDFSWSRVETQGPGPLSGQAAAAAPSPAACQTPRRAPQPPQSFQEILRRQQLAQLLLVVPPTPPDAVLLLGAEAPAPAQPGPVCRAYSQAQGPLAQSSRLYSA